MDVSGIGTSVNTASAFADTTSGTKNGADLRTSAADARAAHKHDHAHHNRRAHGFRQSHALDVFRQELRIRLSARFEARLSQIQPAYSQQLPAPESPDELAQETLGNANQIAGDAPTKAAKSLIAFKATVHETAKYVRETLGEQDYADMDNTVSKLDNGLAEMEERAASHVESRSSVLNVETRSKQRSSIRIRTQEGDVVRLSLKRSDTMSASDMATSADGVSSTRTEVEISSRSRLMISVKGDINDGELLAIQNVFAQAEQIADEFFAGDLNAAFRAAEGFEFDDEQLARVNMRFRMRQVSDIAYTESVRPAPVEAVKPAAAPVTAPVAAAGTGSSEQPTVLEQPAAQIPVADESVANVKNAKDADVATGDNDSNNALAELFGSISRFLRSSNEGFLSINAGSSLTYHHSESFKLDLLKFLVQSVAPDSESKAADGAGSAIDLYRQDQDLD